MTSFNSIKPLFQDKASAYQALEAELKAVLAGETDEILKMATIAATIRAYLPYAYWVGFYRHLETNPQNLIIGPYQGTPACLHLSFDRGICGRAARTGQIQLVDDVHQDPDHWACDEASASELVLPVWKNNRLLAVLDLDATQPAAFDALDAQALDALLTEHFGAKPPIYP